MTSANTSQPAALTVRRVAVLRALQLGDLLCAVPALRALRALHPAAEVTLIGLPWARAFADRFPSLVDGFLEFPGYPGLPERPLDPRRVPGFLTAAHALHLDLAVQLHGGGPFVNELLVLLGARRNAGFFTPGGFRPDPELFIPWPERGPEPRRLLRLTEHLGAPSEDAALHFPVTADDRRRLADAWDGALVPRRCVLVHPGAQLPSRRWPPERFAAVADALSEAGQAVVLTGSQSERGLTRAVQDRMKRPALDLAGRTSLGSLAALLAHARLLVSNDTGLSHLAAALRVPSVIVASGSEVERWAPADRALHRVLSHDVACRPCAHAVCPVPGHPCAAGVTAEAVLRESFALLAAVPEPVPCAA